MNPPRAERRWGRSILVAAIVTLAGGAVFVLTRREPRYEGRTAAQWFGEFDRELTLPPFRIPFGATIVGSPGPLNMIVRMQDGSVVSLTRGPGPLRQIGPATEALKKLGPSAVEYLIRILKTRDSWFSFRYASVFPRLPATLQKYLPIPVSGDQTRRHVVMALSGMLKQGASPDAALVTAIREEGSRLVEDLARAGRGAEAMAMVQALDLRSPGAAWALGEALLSPGSDARLRDGAGRRLIQMGPIARSAVPALRRALGDPDTQIRYLATRAIEEIGPGAIAAAPEIRRALQDENQAVRFAAARALTNLVGVAAENGKTN